MSEARPVHDAPRQAGRYTLHAEIASGGMATVYYGQLLGAHGFSRVVAIKRMLPRLARDPRFHAMFVDEARLASRVQHPNVVPILDVVDEQGEVMIVMEYVRGPPLSALLDASLRRFARVPVPIVANIGCAMLAGLHAAHEARDRSGRLLGIVHRDVSPQNVLVGVDGVTRIMDFGVARATELRAGDDRKLTGKLAYMAPEQLERVPIDRRTDVFATAVVIWGALAGRRLFRGTSAEEALLAVRTGEIPPLSEFRNDVPPALEAALHQALKPDRERRPKTAEAFAAAIENASNLASARAVADWVSGLLGTVVSERDRMIVEIEKTRTAMSVELAGPDSEPVRSDVLTNEWLRPETRDQPAAPTNSGPSAAEVPVPPPRPRRSFIVAAVAVSAVAAAAFVLGRGKTLPQPESEELGPRPPAPVASLVELKPMIDATVAEQRPLPPAPSSATTRTPQAWPTRRPPPPPPPSASARGKGKGDPYLPKTMNGE